MARWAGSKLTPSVSEGRVQAPAEVTKLGIAGIGLWFLLAACVALPADPVYYLHVTNNSGKDVLIQVVYKVHKSDGVPDAVYASPSGSRAWLIPPRTGYGPDAVAILDDHCGEVSSLLVEPDVSGAIVIEPDQGISLSRSDAPSGLDELDAVDRCPNR